MKLRAKARTSDDPGPTTSKRAKKPKQPKPKVFKPKKKSKIPKAPKYPHVWHYTNYVPVNYDCDNTNRENTEIRILNLVVR